MQITGPIGGQWWGEVESISDWINLRQKEGFTLSKTIWYLKISCGACCFFAVVGPGRIEVKTGPRRKRRSGSSGKV